VCVRAEGHAAVLVQPVHDQHQPAPGALAAGRGLGEQVQQARLAGGFLRGGREVLPVSAHSCSIRTVVNASRVSWAASRAVMKNDTIHTRPANSGGERRTKVDSRADFPAQGPARHHMYRPRSGCRQNAANSANSASRPSNSGGAMRLTCSRYADRTGRRTVSAENWLIVTTPAEPTPTPLCR
jgi:hypothetical protein